MKTLNMITRFTTDANPRLNLKASEFYSLIRRSIPLLISSLLKYATHPSINLEKALEVRTSEGRVLLKDFPSFFSLNLS